MARCGCGASCSCLITAGSGVQVDGIGTVENPYVISSDASELLDRIEFVDSSTIDFSASGVGTLLQPMQVTATASLAMTDLTDVEGTPADNQVPVWVVDHWEFQDQSGGGGGGSGLPDGGTTGQMLVKTSSADGDADWKTMVTDAVILRTNVVQTMASGTEVSMVFAAAQSTDPLGMWDGSSIVTAQRDGLYEITMNFSFASTAAAAGSRITLLRIGGTTVKQWYETFVAGQPVFATHVVTAYLTAGQTVQMRQYQSSGANLDTYGAQVATGPSMYVVRLGDSPSGSPLPDLVMGEKNYYNSRAHAAALSVPNITLTPVPFDTLVFEDGITWDAPNNCFVAPVTGYYSVAAVLTYATNATGQRYLIITVNGAAVFSSALPAVSSGASSSPLGTTLRLVAGDKVVINAYQSSGGALALSANSTYNRASIVKVPAPVVPGRAASGLWGAPPLDIFGSDSLVGRDTYVDSNGQLRTVPTTFDYADNGFTATTPPMSFPQGVSILTFNSASNTNWPVPGVPGQVNTFRRNSYGMQQFIEQKSGTLSDQAMYYRAFYGGTSGSWGPWIPIYQDSGWVNLINIASGWTVPSPYITPQARLLNGEVIFRGRLVNAAFTGGYTDMCQLPASIPNPLYTSAFPAASNTTAYKALQILSGNGMVQIYSSTTSGAHVDFASVRYPTN